jgi:alkyl hydroperoxide reductase subunit AhpF
VGFLRQDDLAELQRIFGSLSEDVRVVLVTDDLDLRLLVDEVAAASGGRITVEKKSEADGGPGPRMELSSPLAKGKLYFLGLPVGYEMATFVGALAALGGGLSGPLVSPEAQAKLDALEKDVTLEVFSTPG